MDPEKNPEAAIERKLEADRQHRATEIDRIARRQSEWDRLTPVARALHPVASRIKSPN